MIARIESTVSPSELRAMISLLGKSERCFESVVKGRSMEPTLPEGAAIRIGPLGSDGYRVGQIVLYAVENRLVAHRVVYRGGASRSGPIAITRGDNCLSCDPPIREDAMFGIVTSVSVVGRWQEPAAVEPRSMCRRLLAATNFGLIRTCLTVNFRLARFVARLAAAVPSNVAPRLVQ